MIRVELDHATVAFTTRSGGRSTAPFDSLNLGLFSGDDERTVCANIEQVRKELGVDRIALVRQVHGSKLIDAHAAQSVDASECPEADGMFTAAADLAMLVTGADCPPVAIAGPDSLAMLHCGWRPLAAGIVEAAIARFGEQPLQAAVGPGISRRHYEVGPEVIEQLGADGTGAADGRRLCLRTVIETKLKRAGVDRIEHVDACTFADADEFFSYRRDGTPTGRQAGIAWRC